MSHNHDIEEVTIDPKYEVDVDSIVTLQEPVERKNTTKQRARKQSKQLPAATSKEALLHGALVKFRNLEYSVRMEHDKEEQARTGTKFYDKVILKSISGVAKPGEIFAILGSSGAGKTTLLDCLAGRKSTGTLTGDVTINGHPLDKSVFKYISAYVMQDDVLLGSLTTFESLTFAAQMRDPKAPSHLIETRVNKLLADMALEHAAETYVGDELRRGLSGGEKKRLAIALQLLADPKILFLDEPTTGLDAYNSVAVIQRVQDICKQQGRTIITSIHQPRYSIFALFDRVMILSKGDVAYHGPADQALSVFSSLGYNCPEHENPADYLIDVIVAAEANPDKSIRAAIVKESESYVQKKIDAQEIEFTNNLQADATLNRPTFFDQFSLLCQRSGRNLIRNPIATFVALVQAIFMGLVLGGIYFGVTNEQPGIQNRLGVLFFVILNQVFGFMPALAAFVDERVIFMRERAAGLYETGPYYCAKIIVEIPPTMVVSIVFASIIYFMVGLAATAKAFFIFFANLCFMNMVALGLFTFIGAAAPNLRVAQIFGPLSVIVFALFGGFYVNLASLPDYLVWLEYPSFVRYSFQILAKNEFENLQFTWDANATSYVATGKQELEILGMSNVSFGSNFAILGSMAVIYFFLGYVALRLANFEKR